MALTKLNARSATALDATVLTGNLPSISGASLTGLTPGISVARSWRQNTNTTISGTGVRFLTANWEALDQTVEGEIGTNLTESSGVFSFPSTGIYYVTFSLYCNLENDDYHFRNIIHATSDNSNYNLLAQGSSGIERSSGSYQFSAIAHSLFDVTDTSNCKLKFGYNSALNPTNSAIYGNTSYNQTSAIFIRLGDT
jgi:hypothetical protein|tara:strand:- start:217 stop:804 length:588 start_codon:yes stop_codon:yes gene_type:complete